MGRTKVWTIAIAMSCMMASLADARVIFRATFDNFSAQEAGGVEGKVAGHISFPAGKQGGAAQFGTGSLDYQTPALLTLREPLTFGAWVKPVMPIGTQVLLEVGNEPASQWVLSLANNRVSLGTTRQATDHLSVAVLPTGEWTHVAATVEQDKAQLYVNGELDSVVALEPNPRKERLVFATQGIGLGGYEYLQPLLDAIRSLTGTVSIGPLELNALERRLGGGDKGRVGFSLDPLELKALEKSLGGGEAPFNPLELNALERSLGGGDKGRDGFSLDPLELNALAQSLGGGEAPFNPLELNALERSLTGGNFTTPLDEVWLAQGIMNGTFRLPNLDAAKLETLAKTLAPYYGSADDVFVADAAMTEAEIVALMNGEDAVPTAVEVRGKLATRWAALKNRR